MSAGDLKKVSDQSGTGGWRREIPNSCGDTVGGKRRMGHLSGWGADLGKPEADGLVPSLVLPHPKVHHAHLTTMIHLTKCIGEGRDCGSFI